MHPSISEVFKVQSSSGAQKSSGVLQFNLRLHTFKFHIRRPTYVSVSQNWVPITEFDTRMKRVEEI